MNTWLVGAALTSALLHAAWNASVKASPRPVEAMTAQMLGSAALEALAEQLAGQKIQRQDAALAVLGRLLDPVPLLDDVGRGDPDLLAGEVEPVLAQRADLAAPSSGRDRGPQVQAEFLVLGPHEVE